MVRMVPLLKGLRKKRTTSKNSSLTVEKTFTKNIRSWILGLMFIGAVCVFVASKNEKTSIMIFPSDEGPKQVYIASSEKYIVQNPQVRCVSSLIWRAWLM